MKTIKRLLLYSTGIIIIFILWTILSLAFGTAIVPYPWQAAGRLVLLCSHAPIWYHLLVTYTRTLIGFSLAFVAGAAIGIVTGRMHTMEKTFFFPVSLLQGAPPLIWIIPIALVFGTKGVAPIAIVFFVVLPLAIINIQEGVKSIDRESIDMFRIYADSPFFLVKELFLPKLGSHIKTFVLTGFLIALKSSILGEWFGAQDGIGRIINEYFYTFDMSSFYAVSLFFLVTLGISALVLNKVVARFFERRPSVVTSGPRAQSGIGIRKRSSSLAMRDVSFSYGKKLVLDGISFSLSASDTVLLTGDSGAGKTTFAKLATGLLAPDRGKVSVPSNGCLIFQDDILLPHLDCFGNASLPARKDKIRDYSSRTLIALERSGLSDSIHLFPDELSGGMKKDSRSRAHSSGTPDFIILDEPFNKLHREARDELWKLYFMLFADRGIPSIIITHFPEEIDGFSNYIRMELSNKKLHLTTH